MYILGLGVIVVDHQMQLDRLPDRNEKVDATSLRTQIGGPVPTALVLLSRLGHRCGLISTVGDDSAGRAIRADLQNESIDLDGLRVCSEGATGLAHVWTDAKTGERTIACLRPTALPTLDDLERPLIRKQLTTCDVLHLDGWPGPIATSAAEIVSDSGGLVMLDAGSPKEGLSELLPHVNVINCPEQFANQFFGEISSEEAARRLLSMGPKLITQTLGERGVVVSRTGADGELIREHVPALNIEAVDTTGAGDVFAAALLHALLKNASPVAAARFAVVAAGLKCLRIGNRDALPTEAMIRDRLSEVAT